MQLPQLKLGTIGKSNPALINNSWVLYRSTLCIMNCGPALPQISLCRCHLLNGGAPGIPVPPLHPVSRSTYLLLQLTG